ncbi:hypothetical protein GGG16DRAFT_68293 [Schizophyllum commune]
MSVCDADHDFSDELRYPYDDAEQETTLVPHADPTTLVRPLSPRDLLASCPALERAYEARDHRDLAVASHMNLIANRATMNPIASVLRSLANYIKTTVETDRHRIPCPPMMSEDPENGAHLSFHIPSTNSNTSPEGAINGLLRPTRTLQLPSSTALTVPSGQALSFSEGTINGGHICYCAP